MSRRKDGRPRSAPSLAHRASQTHPGPSAAERASLSLVDPRRIVPADLKTDEFFLRPIAAADAARDHAAVMETRVDLRVWEQSSWPAEDFTVEANRADLADLEQRHADRRAFTYTVLDPTGLECLGCVYIVPTSATFLTRATVSPVSADARWADVEAVVYFWVRESRISSDMDVRLLAAVRVWMDEVWALERTVFVANEQYARQVRLLESAGFSVEFALDEPGKPGTYLAFG